MIRPMIHLFTALTILIAAPVAAETRVPKSKAEISMGFAPVVRQAAPAVVNIYARRVVQVQSGPRASPFANDPFFREFMRDFGPGLGAPRKRVQNSLGSGVTLSADGIMVTNYHVVGRTTDIRVVLNDRREYTARVMLGDRSADLAILQIENAVDMPHLTLRNSDNVEVGELILAIGNPFGVGQTVTSGIVSGLARSGTATGSGRGYFIQTDAPINPGNSGGALIDISGRVIGINTRILSRSGGSNGIGFAIPAALVKQFVAQARAGNDRFLRPWAGMSGQTVDPDIAESLGLGVPSGIVISGLHAQSPFRAAGFRAGDVVTAVDGRAVNTPAEMIFRMSVAGLGSAVKVRRYRDGDAREVAVTMVAAPETPPRNEVQMPRGYHLEGARIANINPGVTAEFGLPFSARGVVVFDPGPIAGRRGLRRGDLILSVGGRPVANSAEAARVLDRRMGARVMTVARGGRTFRVRL